MLQFSLDKSLCIQCGECIKDCTMRVIDLDEDNYPLINADKEQYCVKCQHCLAICPTGAVSILGKSPAGSKLVAEIDTPSYDQMSNLVRSRRSIRRYKDENVDPNLINDLLKTLSNVPTGVNSQKLTFTVIDDKDVMNHFKNEVMETLITANEENKIPDSFAYLKSILAAPPNLVADTLFRHAPHALIVSAPPEAPTGTEDVTLALAYFELLAQSAGLGTVWWGLFDRVVTAIPALKSLVGLPDDHDFYAMLFGIPDVNYTRTVQRDDAAIIKRVVL